MRKACLLVSLLVVPCISAVSAQQNQASTELPPNGGAAPASMTAPAPASTAAVEPVAKLHIYRQHRYGGSALAPTIALDGTQVARVGNGRRVTIKLVPGAHTIASDDKSSSIAIDARGGQDYYVRVDEETGFWKGHGRLTLVMAEQGSAEYKMEKPIEPDRKIAKDLIEDEQ